MDTVSGLTQAFTAHHAKQSATMSGLERLSTSYGAPLSKMVTEGHFSRVIMCKNGQKNMTERRFHLTYNSQAAGLVERKNEILKQQIKLLIGKTALARKTQVLF